MQRDNLPQAASHALHHLLEAKDLCDAAMRGAVSVGLVRDCTSGGLPRCNDLNVNREEEASYQGFSIRR